jgi:hypothetical protein
MGGIAFEIDAFVVAASSCPRAIDQAGTVGAYLAGLARMTARAAIAGAGSELDAIAVAGGKAVRARDRTHAFRAGGRADRRDRTGLAAGSAIGGVVARVLACFSAALIAGVTGKATGPVAGGLAVRRGQTGFAACATVGDVARRVDAGVVAGELIGSALRLARAVRTDLPRRARAPALPAVMGIAPHVDAGVAAHHVSRIALEGAAPLRADAAAMRHGWTTGTARPAMSCVSLWVDAFGPAANERGPTADLTRALATRGAPAEGRRARGVAATAMLQVVRGINACSAAVRRAGRANVGAMAVRANSAGGAGVGALAAVSRVVFEIDAIISAADERIEAFHLAAARFTSHGGTDAGLARLATGAAVQHIRARVDAAAAARHEAASTSESAVAIHAQFSCAGWRIAGLAAGAAMLGVAIQLHALTAARRFALTTRRRGIRGTLAHADSGRAALIPRHAPPVRITRESFQRLRHRALTRRGKNEKSEARGS